MVESLLFFIEAGAGVGDKNTRSRSKMDRLRNTAPSNSNRLKWFRKRIFFFHEHLSSFKFGKI